MPTAKARPADLTGARAEALRNERAEELKAREGEISLINARAEQERKEPVDLSNGPGPQPQEIESSGTVEVQKATKKLRVNTDLESVTIGRGNHWDFETGREYVVPAYVYDHLEEKGYVWH
jgi:hypothetical protein